MARQYGALTDLDNQVLVTLELAIKEINRSGPKLRAALRKRMKADIEDPLASKIRSNANGPHGALAASSVATTGGSKPAIWLGRGGGLGADVAFGSEFGGRKPKKVQHPMTSRSRTSRYIIRRRTTMQFRGHRGRRGYWMIPTMEREFPNTVRKMDEIVMDVLSSVDVATVVNDRIRR